MVGTLLFLGPIWQMIGYSVLFDIARTLFQEAVEHWLATLCVIALVVFVEVRKIS